MTEPIGPNTGRPAGRRCALILAIANSLWLSACTTIGKPYSPPPTAPLGKASVHLLRTTASFGNLWPTGFWIDDREVVSLHDKGYTWIHLDPGAYHFEAGNALANRRVGFLKSIDAGKEYFFEFNIEKVGYNQFRNVLKELDPAQARSMMPAYAYKEAAPAPGRP